MPSCYAWTAEGYFATAFYANVHVFSMEDKGSNIQASATVEFRCPLLVASSCQVWNRKWMAGLVWPGTGEIPMCWNISRHGWKQGFSGLQHYLLGDWWVEGKFYWHPAQSPETLWMVSPVAIKESRSLIFLGLLWVQEGDAGGGARPRLKQRRAEGHIPRASLKGLFPKQDS